MSSHTTVSPKPTTLDVRQPIMDTAMRIAQIMTDANSRLSRLQSEAATAAFADTSKHINALLNTAKSPTAISEWPSLYQENAQKMVDMTRGWFEILSQTQAELSKLLGKPFTSNNVEAQNYLNQFTRAITDAHHAAEDHMKDFLAKTFGAGEANSVTKEKVAQPK
jgi:phasin family protein